MKFESIAPIAPFPVLMPIKFDCTAPTAPLPAL